MRTVSDTPLLHVEHAVPGSATCPSSAGSPRRRRRRHTPVWLARTPQWAITQALDERPEWWPHLLELLATYSYAVTTVAADLMIRSSERRCAAVLARLAAAASLDRKRTPRWRLRLRRRCWPPRPACRATAPEPRCKKLMSRGLVEPGYGGITCGRRRRCGLRRVGIAAAKVSPPRSLALRWQRPRDCLACRPRRVRSRAAPAPGRWSIVSNGLVKRHTRACRTAIRHGFCLCGALRFGLLREPHRRRIRGIRQKRSKTAPESASKAIKDNTLQVHGVASSLGQIESPINENEYNQCLA